MIFVLIVSTIDEFCFNSDHILKVIHGMNDTMSHSPDNFSCFITSIFAILMRII